MHGTNEGTSTGHSTMHSESRSSMDTQSESWARARNAGQSHAEGRSVSQQQSRNFIQGVSGGMSTGLLPGISINRSWQTEAMWPSAWPMFAPPGIACQSGFDGGRIHDQRLSIHRTQQGSAAAAALVPQPSRIKRTHACLTIQPLQADEAELRAHAFTFTPWTELEDGDPFSGNCGHAMPHS